jgi:hypothetical protein
VEGIKTAVSISARYINQLAAKVQGIKKAACISARYKTAGGHYAKVYVSI